MITKAIFNKLVKKLFTSLSDSDTQQFIIVNQTDIGVADAKVLTDYDLLANALDAVSWPIIGNYISNTSTTEGTRGMKAVSSKWRYECVADNEWQRTANVPGLTSLYLNSGIPIDDSGGIKTDAQLKVLFPDAVFPQIVLGQSGEYKFINDVWRYYSTGIAVFSGNFTFSTSSKLTNITATYYKVGKLVTCMVSAISAGDGSSIPFTLPFPALMAFGYLIHTGELAVTDPAAGTGFVTVNPSTDLHLSFSYIAVA